MNDLGELSMRSARAPRLDDDAFDVVIVGGGAVGSAAAVALGRLGPRVALVDTHAIYPPNFRADKVAGDQIELLRRLGLLDILAANSVRSRSMINILNGRVLDREIADEYNLPYEDLVRALRAAIPPSVALIVGRVRRIDAGGDSQRVELSNGECLRSRLVILASGNSDAMRRMVGVSRRVLRENHSVSIGFDLAAVGRAGFDFEGLTCYGGDPRNGVDYISFFPFRRALRANLFVYRDPRDPWLKAFQDDPKELLLTTLPGLAPYLGAFEILDRPQVRPVDLYEVDGYRRSGVALVGDAFRSGCPSVGMGLSRGFTDVDRLCNVHIPRWLSTPGMGADKIGEFYDDPVKRACDTRAARQAEYRRAATMAPGVAWAAHRQRVFLQRRLRALLAGGRASKDVKTAA